MLGGLIVDNTQKIQEVRKMMPSIFDACQPVWRRGQEGRI